MGTLVLRFVKNESGATAIEYGLIAVGIAVAIIGHRAGARHKLERHVQQRFYCAKIKSR
jgi:pilus assembly protein Flp/PilA